MIVYFGKRITADEFARYLIWDKGRVGFEFWEEEFGLDYDKMTEREVGQVDRQIAKHLRRVRRLLRADAVCIKIFGD